MTRWHTVTLAAMILGGCGMSHTPSGCTGSGPDCYGETSPGSSCCTDTFTGATCVDGAWVCPTGSRPEGDCAAFAPMCEGPPDAGGPGPDGGSGSDAGSGEDAGGPPWDPADAGPVACQPDAGPWACLNMGCVPYWDDACCSACDPSGGCADCTDLTYSRCRPQSEACATWCDAPAQWACDPQTPDCSGAHPTDLDSCDQHGCVPAYPSGTGAPALGDRVICVPVHRDVCVSACRRVEPPCPEGTVPERDGSCYTDRCIPAFVCE